MEAQPGENIRGVEMAEAGLQWHHMDEEGSDGEATLWETIPLVEMGLAG